MMSHTHLGLVLSVLAMTLPTRGVADPSTDENDFAHMDIEELMEVEISVASKKAEPLTEAPGVVSVVPRDEFVAFGDRNLWQLMQRQPSIFAERSFAFSDNLVSFRGDLSTHQDRHTLILFNGRPIRESALGYSFPVYMAFPLTSLESVEIIRGPGSVLYGTNAFTGVINLKSRPVPDELEILVSGMGGSYGYYDTTVSAAGRSGALGFLTDLRAAGQNGWPYRLYDSLDVYGEDRDYNRSFSGTAHMDYRGLTFDVFAADLDIFTMGALPYLVQPA